MRRFLTICFAGSALAAAIALPAHAAPTSEILYRLTRVRDSIWRYDYTLVNRATDSRASSVVLFETYFPYGQASNIGASLIQSADGWRAQARDPFSPDFDSGPLGENNSGVYKAEARNSARGLRSGGSLEGFAVEFEWLGGTPPAEQNYMAIHDFDSQNPSLRARSAVAARGEVSVGAGRGTRINVGEPTLSYHERGVTRLDPSVPEPTTLALIGSGLVATLIARRRRGGSSA